MSIPAQGAEGAETRTAGQSLDLRDLHAANIARQAEWCPDQVPDLSFRGNELGGECGEAQNVIKKLERERQGWRGSRATKDDLADELADVVICADLCAVTAGIDLGAAVRRKFNATSEKQGLSVFLPLPALASPCADSDERTAGVLWSAWSEDDCDSDPRIDPMAQKVTEWFVGRWPVGAEEPECRILIGAGRSAEIIARRIAEKLTSILNTDAIVARKSAPPAQPAGAVPDSLRALIRLAIKAVDVRFEASEYEFCADSPGYTPTAGERAMLEDFGSQILSQLEASLFASHPAGQSAGSGAEDQCGAYPECGCYAEGNCGERTAPDSTRTGQGEATYTQAEYDESHEIVRRDGYQEGVQDAAARAGLDGEYRVSPDPDRNVPDPETMLDRIAERVAVLAARPAAPEAQGGVGSDHRAVRHRRERVPGRLAQGRLHPAEARRTRRGVHRSGA